MSGIKIINSSAYCVSNFSSGLYGMDSKVLLIIFESMNPYIFLTSHAEQAYNTSLYWECSNVESIVKQKTSRKEMARVVMGNANFYINKYADLDTSCFEQLNATYDIHDYKSLEFKGKRSQRWR